MFRLKEIIHKALLSVDAWLDIYRKPGESLLSSWFMKLYTLLENESEKGNINEKIWYRKPGEMELTEEQNDSPLYKIRTLLLPEVTSGGKKYWPQISEVTMVSEFATEGTPEVQTWRLNLVLFDEKGNNAWPEMTFSRNRYNSAGKDGGQPEMTQKHEISYSEGRNLTAYEVKLIKSIFDLSREAQISKNQDRFG